MLSVCALAASLAALTPDPERERVVRLMHAEAEHYGALSRQIWEYAELGYKEHRSAKLLRDQLQSAGFRITENVGGIPTAFVAEWGQGKPVTGIMGEFDALPGLSQEAVPERKPLVEGGAGHGCGHNLFGVAAAHAAIAVKRHLEEKGLAGTVRFFGTPAEEGGSGKVYMIRAGAFEGTDVVLTWHPGNRNSVNDASMLAIISGRFRFRGVPAHASSAPEAGRSALDAVLLMNHATEMLREHMPREARIHYVILNGGAAPNIVPDFAETYYYARHPQMAALDGLWDRILKCAGGAAMATETRLEHEVESSNYELLPNDALLKLLRRNLSFVGGVRYTAQEQAFAEKLAATLEPGRRAALGTQEELFFEEDRLTSSASSDVGDVSWNVPTAQFTAATWVPGTPAHSWQSAACSGMSIGRKGMIVAAKTLALSALDVFYDPNQVELARESFRQRKGGQEYRSRIPAAKAPPLDYRDKR